MRVLRSGRPAVASNFARRAGIGLAAVAAVMIGGIRGTQDAIANGDTRTLTLYNNNTKESLTVTFRRNGQYDSAALEQLNWFLRDWRKDEATKMDPRLFDTVWEVYREVGSSAPVQVNSGYRSPSTNAMLRRRSSVVAKNSQHMLGKALDFYLSDTSAERLRAIGMRLQNGGVGYYPNAYTPFVHLDVGSVRAWPRMTRDQLTRLFPDGRTVHIPADGTPLPGYQEARAEILARGGSVAGYTMVADAGDAAAARPRRKSFWATLFGSSDEDEDVEEIRAASRPGRNLFASRGAPDRNAYRNPYGNESTTSVLQAYNDASAAPAALPQPEPAAPRTIVASAPSPATDFRDDKAPPPLPPTRIAGLPSTVATPSGPTLSWQQGPAGQIQNGSDLTIGRGTAFAPIPPRRPDEIEIVATGALAYAPMPPVRPGSLAATNPIPGLPELRGSAQAVASLQPTDAPLPPPRPAIRPVALASAGPIELPASIVQPPEERSRGEKPKLREPSPATTASIAAASKAVASTAKGKSGTIGSINALTSAGPDLRMGFSSKPTGDLATNRFTGPAVKPLQVR